MRPFKTIKEAFPELKYVYQELKTGQFVKTVTQKIRFIRHTAHGLTVRYLKDWYDMDKRVIGTHFAIDIDGTLYQYYSEDYWAYHTGMGTDYDAASFGCEQAGICYVKQAGDKFYWQSPRGWLEYMGPVIKLDKPVQGYTHWAVYPLAQVDTQAKLIAYLCYNHNIPLVFEHRVEYLGSKAPTKGILNHSNISTQRVDPGPAYPYTKEEELVRKYFIQLCNKHGYPVYAKKN